MCGECKLRLTVKDLTGLGSDLHLICERCQGTRRLPGVSPFQREIFQSVQSLSPAAFVQRARTHVETVNELSEVLRRLVVRVVGRDLMNGRTLAVNS